MSKHGGASKSGSSASNTPAWLPPDDDDSFTVPLNLPKELARIRIGADDRVVVENMPQGAALTIGDQKPDGSWVLRSDQLPVAEYIPLTHNGQTYYLQLNVITSDPSDHGLPKTKARLKIAVKVPEAKLPPLDAFPLSEPKALPPPAEAVIHLPAGPNVQASPAPEALALPAPAAAKPPSAPTVELKPAPAAAPPPTVELKPRPAAAPPPAVELKPAPAPVSPPAAEVQPASAPVAMPAAAPIAASAPPLGAGPAVEVAPALEPVTAPRVTIDLDKHLDSHATQWKSLLGNELKAAERRLEATQKELLERMRSVLLRDDAARATAVETALKTDFTGRAETAAPIAMQADVEARMAALYESRLAESEATWKSEIARRIEGAQAEWRKAEAERMAAAENRWRVEHEQRLEAMLANVGILVRHQLGDASESATPATESRPATASGIAAAAA